jgi:hypothetical protein
MPSFSIQSSNTLNIKICDTFSIIDFVTTCLVLYVSRPLDTVLAGDWFQESVWRQFGRVSSAGKVLRRLQSICKLSVRHLPHNPRGLTLGCRPWFRNPLSNSAACEYEHKPNSCEVPFKRSRCWFPTCAGLNQSTSSQSLFKLCFNISSPAQRGLPSVLHAQPISSLQ